MIKYTIGADPEVFLKRDQDFVSAHDVIKGTKMAPFPVRGGAIQVDGTAAEFNIPPASTPEEFSASIQMALISLQSEIKKHDTTLSIYVTPVARFDKDYFTGLPAETKVFGCSPDYSAWTGKSNPGPSTTEPVRTGAGHIHIGWGEDIPIDRPHIDDCEALVRQLDATLLPLSCLWDSDLERRELYGDIGAYRPKDYGVEYRSLSNAFLKDRSLFSFIFNATKKAATLLDSGRIFEEKNFPSNILRILQNGLVPNRLLLLRYHNYLNTVWQFPALPDKYLKEGLL